MIDIRTIATSGLGDRSYLATDGQVGVVIDPQRDIDRVLGLADQVGARITHVAETHIHNDYVSGGLDLARRTGAAYLVNAADEVGFERTPVSEGDEIAVGEMRLRVIATPGHTHHHLSYALLDDAGTVQAVFTGGSMLYGTTGRTDLVSPHDTVELTHAQYHSVRRLAAELPGDAAVYPTHGFGSFCASTPASGADGSTVGDEAIVNPALTQGEQDFVDTLIAGLGAFPSYYARMGPANASGPAPVDLTPPEPVDPAELRRRLEAGQWVVDLRERTAFAAGHLPGSLGYELSTPFVTYFGWTFDFDADLTLIGDSPAQVADAQRELVRIGIDRLAGAATGPIASLADGQELRSYPVSDFPGLATARAERDVVVLDARRDEERAAGGVRGSVHIPLHQLPARRDEVPDGEVWVYCGSGYRASVAASMLDRPGRDLVLIDDDWPDAAEAGLAMTSSAGTSSTSGTTPQAPGPGGTVDAATLRAWVAPATHGAAGAQRSPMVVDVRSAAEYETAHIRGSYHVPLATLAEHTGDLAAHFETPVVLVCQSGVRAEQARRHLGTVGLDRAHVLDGGLPAYTAAGGDVVVGRRAWALERQVRLVAGSLVLAGLTAGRLLSPKARLLAGGIGMGLTFSALTDTCAMGAALARLPINRGASEPVAADTLAAVRDGVGPRDR